MAKREISIVEDGIEKTIIIDVPDDVEGGWGNPARHRYLGKHITRIEGNLKVTGRAKYTYDIQLPGMLYARVLRSPYPMASISSIDTNAAKKSAGVKAVITLDNKTVRYHGDEIAAVAAESIYQAEDAIRLIKVDYRELPFVVNEEKARQPTAPKVFNDRSNIREGRSVDRGDIDDGFSKADIIVERTYRTQVQTHSSLETHGTVAKWDGNKLTVWCSTQGITGVKNDLVNHFGLSGDNVRVICDHMGGGFGSKFGAGSYSIIAARLAKEANAPVKLMLTRYEEFLCVGNRPSSNQSIKAGATKDGKLIAFQMNGFGTGGIAGGSSVPQPYIYTVPNVRVRQEDVHINAGPACAMRAPGHPQASFAMEILMDELAEKIGMDALEFRKKNDGNQIRQLEYDIGARIIGWSQKRNKTAGAGGGPVKRGIGCASTTWGGGGGRSQGIAKIFSDGTVEVGIGSQDLGTGTRTIVGQVAADELAIDLSLIKVKIGDTDLPPSGASGGSTTAPSVAPTIKLTLENAKNQLFERIASELKAGPTELEAVDGVIRVKNDTDRAISWKQATAKLGMDTITAVGQWAPGLSSSGVAGVQFAEVEVDTETGSIKVVKVVAVQDFGFVLNRLLSENQIIGGVIQGLSWALYENRLLDEQTGRMLNPNFETYKIAYSMEIPEIIPVIFDQPERGVIGLGEPPVIPTAGAIANAIYNAIGIRFYEIPITPDKIIKELYKV